MPGLPDLSPRTEVSETPTMMKMCQQLCTRNWAFSMLLKGESRCESSDSATLTPTACELVVKASEVGWLFGVPIIVMLPEGRGAAIPDAKAMADWLTLGRPVVQSFTKARGHQCPRKYLCNTVDQQVICVVLCILYHPTESCCFTTQKQVPGFHSGPVLSDVLR